MQSSTFNYGNNETGIKPLWWCLGYGKTWHRCSALNKYRQCSHENSCAAVLYQSLLHEQG